MKKKKYNEFDCVHCALEQLTYKETEKEFKEKLAKKGSIKVWNIGI